MTTGSESTSNPIFARTVTQPEFTQSHAVSSEESASAPEQSRMDVIPTEQSPESVSEVTVVKKSRIKRQSGVDALRAFAAFCVVIIHASMPYLNSPFFGSIWCVESVEKSGLVTALFWVIEGFTMPLFFLISGYFSAVQLLSRGPNQYITRRLGRLWPVILFGWIFVMPLMLYTWAIGLIIDRDLPWRKLQSLKFEQPESEIIWGAGHLWYLTLLLVLCLASWAIAKMCGFELVRKSTLPSTESPQGVRLLIIKAFQSISRFPLILLCLAGTGLGSLFLYSEPRILLGFRNEWIPYCQNTLFYAVSFAIGWIMAVKGTRSDSPQSNTTPFVIIAVSLLIGYQIFLPGYFAQDQSTLEFAICCFCFTGFGIFTSVWLMSLALHRSEMVLPNWLKTLADASLWIYLIHPVFAGIFSILLIFVELPGLLKFSLVLMLTLGCCLISYQMFVRNKLLGRILGS